MARSDQPKLHKLPVGSITPEGWLKDQLMLTNDLQKVLGARSDLLVHGAWVKGETLPRYIRGLILLAGVLGDEQLRDKVESYMSAIFDSANEGGDFGPSDSKYLCHKIEAVKTVLSYYELTGDEKAINFLRKFFKSQYNTLGVTPLWYHSRARVLDEIQAIEEVYRAEEADWLRSLAEALRAKTCDWFKVASKFPYRKPADRTLSPAAVARVYKTVRQAEDDAAGKRKALTVARADAVWRKPTHQFVVETSGVSLAKAVKYPCTYGSFVDDDDLKKLSLRFIANLDKYHGNATGMFSCDNSLAGVSPARGIDVEAAAEMMESLVTVLAETGEAACADMLEQIAFNVIGAAASDNVRAVEDIVMPNQLEASLRRKSFFKDSPTGNAFVEGKLSRGAVAVLSAFPTFMQALCMTRDGELDFFAYAPCTINTTVNGAKLRIKEDTGYPFRNTVVFRVEEAEGELDVRINFRVPRNTTMRLISGGQVVATGEAGISVKCILRTGSTFMLKLDIPLCALPNRDGSMSFFKGSLLMASKLGNEIERASSDRHLIEVNTVKKWNFTPIVAKKISGGIRQLYENEITTVNPITDRPFNHSAPPFELTVRCKAVLNWDYDINGFSVVPAAPKFSEESVERSFVPFGCTAVRLSHFPPCLKS